MTNWTALIDIVRSTKTLPSMFPPDTLMPMVAPADLGRAAAARLMSSVNDTGVQYVEGPSRYTPQDVADAFAAALGHAVTVELTPRERIASTFQQMGFSSLAAQDYARMTIACLDEGFEQPINAQRGVVSLHEFIMSSVSSSSTLF